MRDVYLTDHPDEAAVLLDKTIASCKADPVAEIRSLGETKARWRTEILAHPDTGASNGPTEGLNLLVKEVKRCGRGFENFEHYRLRVLLRAGEPTWPNQPTPTHPQNQPSPRSRVEPINNLPCSLTAVPTVFFARQQP